MMYFSLCNLQKKESADKIIIARQGGYDQRRVRG
jgi:hypothetical protein